MVSGSSVSQKSGVGRLTVRAKNMSPKPASSQSPKRVREVRYPQRARLTNLHTGRSEAILLVDPQAEETEDFFAVDMNLELKADLKSAFASFTIPEQRILSRVLLQGYSIKEATRRSRASARSWERWMHDEALPRLRSLLADYRADLKELPYLFPKNYKQPIVDTEPVETVKCKHCTETFTGKGESAFRKLRTHVAAKHPAILVAVGKHMRENDHLLDRSREEFV